MALEVVRDGGGGNSGSRSRRAPAEGVGEVRATLHLGRLWGIRVGLHWSVLAIVVLLVFGIGFAGFPVAYPGYGVAAYLFAGLFAAVAFLVSLLAHEMAHALVARREGQRVEGVTLWMLGGLASLRGQSRSPGAELRVAGVGPLTSVLVAAVFGLATWLLLGVAAAPLLVGVLAYLALVNLVLAAFNLVPAAPLDGGRILRSALWRRWGDRHRAAVVTSRIGRGFGFALVLLGGVGLFAGVAGALGWALVGVFIVVMAGAEQWQAELGAALADLRVRDVMSPEPDTADGSQSVSSFLRDVALVRRHSAFPLLDEVGRLQGVITLSRLKTVPPDRRESTILRDVACPPGEVPIVEPDDPLPEVMSTMSGCAGGRALVFDDGHLVGIVSPTDLSRAVALRRLGAGRGAQY